LGLVREVEPALQVQWDNRAAIMLRIPGVGRAWAQWRTKDIDGLDCRFVGKKGQFNLSRLEGVGATTASVDSKRATGEVMRLVFQHVEPSQAVKLKELLAEHLGGFRESF
jgi:excinuclease ABC subunit A